MCNHRAVRRLTATWLFLALTASGGCGGTARSGPGPIQVRPDPSMARCQNRRVIYSVTTLNVEPLYESKLEIDSCGVWQRMLDAGYGFRGRLEPQQLAAIEKAIDHTTFDVSRTGSRAACEEGAYVWIDVADGREAEFMVEARCSPWRPDPSLVDLYQGIEQALDIGQFSTRAAARRAQKP